ncbi:DUF4846 domain-containing protein [Hungatella hathewayi]|uniref:Uncharacterized protein n=1 Tax=Hungatella hathewayi WAL-18680 TaxID=742737 RepID=G5IGW2_9FIRM|nr:hypothetical protein HMPREF9473_02740 [ [Hungatella hathewayi WAL-18680]
MRKKSWIIMSCILLAAAVSGGQGRGTGTNGTSGTSGTGTWAEEPVDREAVTEPEDTAKEDGAQVVPMEVEPVTETVGGPGMKGDDSLGDVPASVIFPQGMTLETRFLPSAGYERVPAEEGSFLAFMRNQKLKEDGSPVLLYDGTEKHNQSAQAAVFAMPGFDSDLQQCADSVMRMYAEYFYSVGAYEKIAFHLTNGFLMDYPTWREGNRLSVDGNRVSWVKKASYDDSYEYVFIVFKICDDVCRNAVHGRGERAGGYWADAGRRFVYQRRKSGTLRYGHGRGGGPRRKPLLSPIPELYAGPGFSCVEQSASRRGPLVLCVGASISVPDAGIWIPGGQFQAVVRLSPIAVKKNKGVKKKHLTPSGACSMIAQVMIWKKL